VRGNPQLEQGTSHPQRRIICIVTDSKRESAGDIYKGQSPPIAAPQLIQNFDSPIIFITKKCHKSRKLNAAFPIHAYSFSMTEQQRNQIVRMAWEDRTTFDEIFEKTGFAEKDVIKLMRASLKASSFRMWRKRVTGRITKHRKIFALNQEESSRNKVDIPA
jgi:uncharacterized protein (TIGR03643 family)